MSGYSMRPVVYCDSCDLALEYTQHERGLVLLHRKYSWVTKPCEQAGRIFKVRTIELEEIPETTTIEIQEKT